MSSVELCDECGFDGSAWSDRGAVAEIRLLGERWADAVGDLSPATVATRPIEDMWSIGEYVDHVREVLFGMRFVLGIAVEQPDTDLGPPPANELSEEPRLVDLERALAALAGEAAQLAEALDQLAPESWSAVVRFDGEDHDAHWICRHAVHDATHHLLDIDRLKHATQR